MSTNEIQERDNLLSQLQQQNPDIEESFLTFLREHYTSDQLQNINETFSYDPDRRTMTWRDGRDVVKIKRDGDGRLQEFHATDFEQNEHGTSVNRMHVSDYGQRTDVRSDERNHDDHSRVRTRTRMRVDGENYQNTIRQITTGTRTQQNPLLGLQYSERYRYTETNRSQLQDGATLSAQRATESFINPYGAGTNTIGSSIRTDADGNTHEHSFERGAYANYALGLNAGAYYHSNDVTRTRDVTRNTNRDFAVNASVGLENGADAGFGYNRTVTDNNGEQLSHLNVSAAAGMYHGPLHHSAQASINMESGQQQLNLSAGYQHDFVSGNSAQAAFNIGNQNHFVDVGGSIYQSNLFGNEQNAWARMQSGSVMMDAEAHNTQTWWNGTTYKNHANFAAGNFSLNASEDFSQTWHSGLHSNTDLSLHSTPLNIEAHNGLNSNFINTSERFSLNASAGNSRLNTYLNSNTLYGEARGGVDYTHVQQNADGSNRTVGNSLHGSLGMGGLTGVNQGAAASYQHSVTSADAAGNVLSATTTTDALDLKILPDWNGNTPDVNGEVGFEHQTVTTNGDQITTQTATLSPVLRGFADRSVLVQTMQNDAANANLLMQTDHITQELDHQLNSITVSANEALDNMRHIQTRPQRMASSVMMMRMHSNLQR